jgi:hypothetical protein
MPDGARSPSTGVGPGRPVPSAGPHAGRRRRPTTRRRGLVVAGTALLTGVAVLACTPEPSEQTPAPTAGTTASADAVPLLADQTLVELEPGPYAWDSGNAAPDRFMAVVTVPEGYVSMDRDGFGVRGSGDQGRPDDRVLWLWELTEIYSHPCDATGVLQPVGPAVADIAAALAAQPLRDGTEPEPVTIGGFDGYYVELTVPDGTDVDSCPTGRFNSWPGRWMQEGGQVSMVWIVDVDGQQITFEGSHGPSADPAKAAELTTMVESARFTRRQST